MTDSRAMGKMANQVHQKNIHARNDGGPGSGPRGGGGLPKKKTKVSIQQAASALAKQGYTLGPGQFNIKTHETTYEVTKGGKTTKMTTTQIKNKIYG